MFKFLHWEQNRPYIYRVLIFITVATLLTIAIPIKRTSQYQYTKDKPWQGALLTAPYDFPIYKSEEQLRREQDSATRYQPPVYSLQNDITMMMMQELRDEFFAHMSDNIPNYYFAYLNEQLQQAYDNGIIDIDELTKLQSTETLEVFIKKEGNELERVNAGRFQTLKEVHDKILREAPDSISTTLLKSMNISNFLKTNVTYEPNITEQIKHEAIQRISPSKGMVQAGQRIIDRGEIVTPYTYDLLRSLEIEKNKRAGGTIQINHIRIGILIISLTSLLTLIFYLSNVARRYVANRKNNILVLTSISLFVLLTSISTYWSIISPYAIPYVMVLMLLRMFLDSHTALLSYIMTVLLSALFVTDPLSFILVQLVSGIGALISLQDLTNRSQMIYSSFKVISLNIITYLGMFLITDGQFTSNSWKLLLPFGINLVLLNTTYILAAAVERIFGYVSNVSLVELGDINSPLLKALSETAPGTFQHSLQVSILSVAAAEKVGGDTQLIRTGALYHDIGKMKNPVFFTENQGSTNPHDSYSALDSAAIIIRHVTDGIALAQKHNLPTPIIEFIRTHHSTSLVKYFYNTYCNEHPNEEVDPAPFTYPGPRPYTREQGILMLADATEASSRSLKEYTPEIIRTHVNRIIDSIVTDGHLNDTPLTFRDIQTIKEVFISKLQTIYHSRIAYPEIKKA